MKCIESMSALLALLLVAPATNAQRIQSDLDASGMSLHYADTIRSRAASLTPHLEAEWGSGLAEATATYSEFGSSGRSVETMFSASSFISTNSRALVEIGGLAGGSAHSAGGRTGELLTNARVHISVIGLQTFVGGGIGRTWDGFESRNLLVGELGASLASGPINGSVTLAPSLLGDSTRYMDAQAIATWAHAGMEVSVVGGVRIGDQLSDLALGAAKKTWGSANASVPITQTLSIVGAAGTYPINPMQGFPGGRFVSVGLRVSNPLRGMENRNESRGSGADAQRMSGISDSTSEKDVDGLSRPELVVNRATADSITLIISAPGAERVELTGDFTGWDPVALTLNKDGSWIRSFALARGQYQMNVRVNGGKWTVPRSLLSMVDEFGGAVGLLIIE
ncbi:MAG TPA: glycogen-binding domain-containing protein [Gemmatimonadaceae bacterium]|nr:glycogen-binding domain-containing protein [Gemmatimonadaceae bacterium]